MPTQATPTSRSRYITLAEAAERLSVTERTIRNLIARGQLPGYRLGSRTIRVQPADVDTLLVPIPTAASAGGRR